MTGFAAVRATGTAAAAAADSFFTATGETLFSGVAPSTASAFRSLDYSATWAEMASVVGSLQPAKKGTIPPPLMMATARRLIQPARSMIRSSTR